MTTATSELTHLFRALKAPAAARALPKLADRARAEEWSCEQFAAVLLKTEIDSRDSIVYVRLLGRSESLIAGVLQSTSLTFIVAATHIGLGMGVVSPASAAGLIAAGLLSVTISPTLGSVLLRRRQPRASAGREPPSPLMPVISAEDRALWRASAAV
jgi:hypothetical protein